MRRLRSAVPALLLACATVACTAARGYRPEHEEPRAIVATASPVAPKVQVDLPIGHAEKRDEVTRDHRTVLLRDVIETARTNAVEVLEASARLAAPRPAPPPRRGRCHAVAPGPA